MKKKITLICLLFSSFAFAQDYHWSTANLNRALINPAENATDTGIDATVVYRNQWMSVMTPFSTIGINVNSTLPKNFGIGITLIDDKAGSVGWHQTNAILNVNYGFNLGKTKLRLGAGFGIDQTAVDYEKTIFPDQINPDLSIGLNAEQFPSGAVNRFDNTAGVYAAIPIAKQTVQLGVVYNHFLAQNGVSFFGSKLAAENLLNTFILMPLTINTHWIAKPYVNYQNQATFNSATIGSTFHYEINQKQFFTGFSYRLQDAIIGQAGFNINNIQMGINYDYTISSIRANVGGTGAVELFAGYHFRKKKVNEPVIVEKETKITQADTPTLDIKFTVLDSKKAAIDVVSYTLENITDGQNIKSDTASLSSIYSKLELCKEYKISVSKKGYLNYSKSFKTTCTKTASIHLLDTLQLEALEVDKNYALSNIYYAYDKTELTEKSKNELLNLFQILEENPTIVIELSSHTDNKGSEEYNQNLSDERAQSCVNYLIELGVAKTRLQAKGYGESDPIAPNENEDGSDNPAGREKNRRTEFKVISF